MALDPSIRRPRRAVLAAALGAAAASVAQAVGRPAPVAASDPNDVVKNVNNVVTAATSLENSANNADVLIGSSLAFGKGVYGYSASGSGVYGEGPAGVAVNGLSVSGMAVSGSSTSGYGVRGFSSSSHGVDGTSFSSMGVVGTSNQSAALHGTSFSASQPAAFAQSIGDSTGVMGLSGLNVPAALPKTGVHGYTSNEGATRGVVGSAAQGTGVQGYVGAGADAPPMPTVKTGLHGRCDVDSTSIGAYGYSILGTGTRGSTQTGTGLLGTASGSAGYGLRSIGRVSLQKASGVATIVAGNSSVAVTPGTDIIAGTFVILTPQADPGTRRIWATIDATANTITIHLSSAVTSSLKVAWLALG